MIRIERSPALSNEVLDALFADAWPDHAPRDFAPVLARSLGWIAAFAGEALVGFVLVAWDGGQHGFVLDPTVRRDHQRRGIGSQLLREAAALARERGLTWLHVDFEPALESFYRASGFAPTAAGLLRV